jgi:hypothetical protein
MRLDVELLDRPVEEIEDPLERVGEGCGRVFHARRLHEPPAAPRLVQAMPTADAGQRQHGGRQGQGGHQRHGNRQRREAGELAGDAEREPVIDVGGRWDAHDVGADPRQHRHHDGGREPQRNASEGEDGHPDLHRPASFVGLGGGGAPG